MFCIVAMMVCVGIGVALGQFMPRAEAQSTTAAIGAMAAVPGQAASSNGSYTVVPVMDSGAGYAWMEFAMAFAPDGTVTVIRTHPKKLDQFGEIFKQFSIK
jgi:hypothetical protein